MKESTDSRGPRDLLTLIVPALVAYIPLLATKPGRVGADTKTYLYLDPSHLLSEAPYVWHESIGLGTITHQNIGYLFPMGPYYWVMDALGVPDWVAQRIWLATVLFLAAAGVRFLLREIGWGKLGVRRGGVLVASMAYMLSPYFLAYAARISVILLPWAALPWLIALAARAVRRGGWRDPAAFALVVLAVGGINATALLLIGLGPLAWIAWAIWVEREATLREALAVIARIGVLTLLTSLWWIAGLWAEGRYGLPVIRYTETYRTVSEASTAPEVLRGLGYWFFYGNDKLGPWIEPSVTYTNKMLVLVSSYTVALIGIGSYAVIRWRHRGFFLALLVVGALAAIGGHPWQEGSLLGDAFTALTRTDAGLSMRSTPRAVPLVVLATAVGTGALVTAIGRQVPRMAWPAAIAVCALVFLNMPTLWTGQLVAENLDRDESIPAYWDEVAAHLDEGDHATRALAVPGADFASYRWGNTVDPVLPGLIDRPYAARELFQWGSAPSANLLNAWDRRFHEGAMDPESIGPIARLLGAGDLVVRNDLQYERYRLARPRQMAALIDGAGGIGEPIGFGSTDPNVAGPEQTMLDEIEMAFPADARHPHAVEVAPVEDPLPILRTRTTRHPLLVAGDGEGVVDAAAMGVLGPNQAVFYSGWFAGDPEGFSQVYRSGGDETTADLVVTDTNRRRGHRWGGLRELTGYTERADEQPLEYDPSDSRLELFPGGDDEATVTEQRRRDEPGIVMGATVSARSYGNPVTFTPDDRPANALDGDPASAWRVGAIDDVHGERLIIELDAAIPADHIELLQPVTLQRNRWITEVRLHFSDGSTVDAELGASSRPEDPLGIDDDGRAVYTGQVIPFPERTFDRVEIEVLETNVGRMGRYDGLSGVGFAEVRIDGVGIEEVVRPPTGLLDRAGESSLAHRLSFLFTRLRSNPAEPVRSDEEEQLRRAVALPTDRTFSLTGQARLSAFGGDDEIDALLGVPGHLEGGVTATSSHRLDGDLTARASATIDGDPTTSWTNGFQRQDGAWLRYRTPAPVTLEDLEITVVADGLHSVPTRIRIEAATNGETPVPVAGIDLPAVADGTVPGNTVTFPIHLDRPIPADDITIVVEATRQVVTRDWYSNIRIPMPISVPEVAIPGVSSEPPSGDLELGCRDDLLSIDGVPVPVEVRGSVEQALDRDALEVVACGDPVDLGEGEHVLRGTSGRISGIDLDRLLLSSDEGGGPLPAEEVTRHVPEGPDLTVTSPGRVVDEAVVTGAEEPFWLVNAQSWSDGWTAEAEGESLGTPILGDAFGNAWLVEPGGSGPIAVSVEFAPQRTVWVALALSSVAALAAVGLALGARRRQPRHVPVPATSEAPLVPSLVHPFAASEPVTTRVARWATAGIAAAVLVNLPAGGLWAILPLGILAWASLRWIGGRHLAAAVATFTYAGVVAFIVIRQFLLRFRPDFTWPAEFGRVHILGLGVVLALGIQFVRDLLVRLAERRDTIHDPNPQSGTLEEP